MTQSIITKEFVQTIIGKRHREIHKGDCGRVLIVAGSEGMAGAAVLCARAALRSGSGLVQVAIPKELFPIVQVGVPEATCLDRDFSKIDLGLYDAIAVGPGLGQNEESIKAVKYILENYSGKLVLDADALNIVAKDDLFCLLKNRDSGKTVITPHVGEARRLLDAIGQPIEREKAVKELYEKTGAIAVLKGHNTLVAIEENKTYINTTGNPGMATAGSGDVLTGIIVSLMGQKKTEAEAATCGVFVHGLAGDLAAQELGEYGLVAGDIAYYTAMALKGISG